MARVAGASTEPAHDELDWPALLSTACTGGVVRAVYQPIVDLARGTVVGFEALARFAGPVSSPELWFAAAAQHGFAARLQAVALREALSARASLPLNCFLTVNVGPEVLASREIRQVWADHPDLAGVVVELTEHVAVHDYLALERELNRLRAAGALIGVDDAGSGYAGLTRLLALRPAIIKLDRELVRDLDRDEAKRALVEMVGTFAGRVDSWLLAEGVERDAELSTLAALGVPLAQGHYLARPAAAWAGISAEAERTLRRSRREVAASGTLRGLIQHPPVITDASTAPAVFADHSIDLIVLCDERQRPLCILGERANPTCVVTGAARYNVDTPIRDAALRCITRSGADWATPLLCTDNAGRYVGIVRIPQLLRALALSWPARRSNTSTASTIDSDGTPCEPGEHP